MSILKEIIGEHIKFREQTLKMARSDLVRTYRGAALGWGWAIIKPVVTIGVYWFAMAIGMRNGGDVNGYPYLLWLISGIVPWFYMSEMLSQGTDCMRKYSYLITKMRYPVSTIPMFSSISKLAVNMILLAVVLVIFCLYGYKPTVYWLQLPLFIFMSFFFFTLWTLFAAPIACISKDFSNLVKSFVFALFWLSGVVWNADGVQNSTIKSVIKLNPITYLTTGFRDCLINEVWFFERPRSLIGFCCVTLVLLLLALGSYKKLRREIPDVL